MSKSNSACDGCLFNEGLEEYEENKFAIFCSNPGIQDYVDMVLTCKLKQEKKL